MKEIPNRKCLDCNYVTMYKHTERWCPKCKNKYKEYIIRTDKDYYNNN